MAQSGRQRAGTVLDLLLFSQPWPSMFANTCALAGREIFGKCIAMHLEHHEDCPLTVVTGVGMHHMMWPALSLSNTMPVVTIAP